MDVKPKILAIVLITATALVPSLILPNLAKTEQKSKSAEYAQLTRKIDNAKKDIAKEKLLWARLIEPSRIERLSRYHLKLDVAKPQQIAALPLAQISRQQLADDQPQPQPQPQPKP